MDGRRRRYSGNRFFEEIVRDRMQVDQPKNLARQFVVSA